MTRRTRALEREESLRLTNFAVAGACAAGFGFRAGIGAGAVLECGVAKAVIGRALVAVFQDVIGLVDFLEAMLAFVVAGIAIGVMHHGELAEGRLEIAIAGVADDSQNLIIIALAHQ